jgi:hypothetical protein
MYIIWALVTYILLRDILMQACTMRTCMNRVHIHVLEEGAGNVHMAKRYTHANLHNERGWSTIRGLALKHRQHA